MVNHGSSEASPLISNRPSRAVDSGDVDSKSSTLKQLRSWFSRYIIYIVLFFLLLLFIVLFLAQAIRGTHRGDSVPSQPSPPDHEPRMSDICTSAGCVLASANILRSLAPNYKDLDACDDFRTLTCAGFDATHEIRAEEANIGSFQVVNDANQLILKRILEGATTDSNVSLFWTASTSDQEIHGKMQDGYSACMNETLLAALGSKPLLQLLEKIGTIFPAKQPKKSKVDDSLTRAIEYMMSIGLTGPVSVDVSADDKDPDMNVIMVSPPNSFGLPIKEYYDRSDIVSSYKDTIGQVLEALLKQAHPDDVVKSLFRSQDNQSVLNKGLVDDLVNFERSMAFAAPNPEDASDVTKYYNPRTVEETEAYIPEVSFKHIIKAFTNYTPSKVIVTSPEYLQSLSKILQATDRRTIRTYLVWKVVQSWAGSIKDDAVKPLTQFNNKLRGKAPDVTQERWKTCVAVLGNDFAWILSRFFVEQAFSREAKDFGDQIIMDVKHEFTLELNNTDWMTASVRELAIDKVRLIRQKIGYPTKSPDITSAEDLQKYYKDVKTDSTTYFSNRLSVVADQLKRSWAGAGKAVDKDEWIMSAQTVNAYYNPPGNEIVLPAGIMQAPFFYDASIPKYLSYGAFGAVAGHELGHAFDNNGRYFDHIGNYTDWWDESTTTSFMNKTSCFVDQYHNYTIPTKDGPLPINGKLTLGENMADSSGLTAAFASWRRREDEEPDLLMPGLEHFTKEQVFFLAYGLTWCGKTRESTMIERLYSDPHSPDFVRIMGTTANSQEFRKAFNCPVKQATCSLWG